MEKSIAQLAGAMLPLQPSSSPGTPDPSDIDLPELTPDERAALELQARRAKRDRLAQEAYWARVKAEDIPVTMTPTELAAFVLQAFERKHGRPYIVDERNQGIFGSLCMYFAGGNAGILDPRKGIFMIGNVGVGKTEIMKLFTFNPLASYGFVGCRTVVDGFVNGEDDQRKLDTIRSYSHTRKNGKPHPFNQDLSGICFDDLGTEEPMVMHYGNKKNVMAEIILNRYDNRLPFNFTHITTNLTKEKVIQDYGSRVWDRMAEMFNILIYDGNKSRREK